MKSRFGIATMAFAAAAGISVLASNASAQSMDQAPSGPIMPPAGPTVGIGNNTYQPVGVDRTEFVRPNGVLVATGGLMVLGSYIPSLVVAASSDHDGDKWLYAPVIGPWVDLGTRGCSDNSTPGQCGITAFDRVALIANGVAQGAGLAQLLWAFTLPQRQLVVTGQADQGASSKATFHIAPSTVGRGNGVVAFGTF